MVSWWEGGSPSKKGQLERSSLSSPSVGMELGGFGGAVDIGCGDFVWRSFA